MKIARTALGPIGLLVATTLIAAACSSAASTPSPAPAATAAASPTPAPTTATVASGTFHKVDGDATGSAFLLHLANGSFEITLEDFSIGAIAHTNVILVNNLEVLKTTDVDQKAIVDLGPLKATSGMQDFPVPAAMAANAMGYHTVVLWDTQMLHAIAAASLQEK